MDLIIHQVMELQVVGVANSDQVVKGLAGTAVIEDGLAVFPQARQLQGDGAFGNESLGFQASGDSERERGRISRTQ